MEDKKMNMVPVIVGLVVLVGIGASVFAYTDGQNRSAMKEKEAAALVEKEAMMKTEETMTATQDVMMERKNGEVMQQKGEVMKKGSYEVYSAEKLARADTGDVVLFFRAGWCPTCRALDADIRANAGSIPAGVTILEVNYDTSTALKQKYGVTTQHTLVQVASDGSRIAKWEGTPTLAGIVSNLK